MSHAPLMPLNRRHILRLGGLAALSLAACSTGDPKPSSPSSTAVSSGTAGLVVDAYDRKVVLPEPAQRAVVVSRYTNELIRAMGSIDKVVGVDQNTSQDRAYWPQFDPKDVIGTSKGLNFEQILALNADVLIEGNQASLEADAAKVKPGGVETVAVVPWDIAHFGRQIQILGEVFGNQTGAQKVLHFFESNMKAVKDAVAGQKPVSVYWEYGDPFTTCVPGTSNQGWYDMILAAGGQSIFADPNTGDKVDPEKILKADPDVIIKTSSGPALKNTGVYTPPTKTDMEAMAAEMLSRPGWKDLKAVKNGRVHITTGFCGGGLGKMVGATYAATWFHPDQTKQIKPDDIFAEWMAMQKMKPIKGHNYLVPKP